ncbi:MAG: TfuA-like protein, partial [Myxococcaceae bacterium]
MIAFLGPSLPAAEARGLGELELRPPARRGDIWRALVRAPRAIALVDGVFEASPSVWHHELRAALDAGVRVFGAASMGALRAAELAAEGMRGVGCVHAWVCAG